MMIDGYYKEKIGSQRNEALVFTNAGMSQYPDMSYEDGVVAALAWVLGESEDAPIQ